VAAWVARGRGRPRPSTHRRGGRDANPAAAKRAWEASPNPVDRGGPKPALQAAEAGPRNNSDRCTARVVAHGALARRWSCPGAPCPATGRHVSPAVHSRRKTPERSHTAGPSLDTAPCPSRTCGVATNKALARRRVPRWNPSERQHGKQGSMITVQTARRQEPRDFSDPESETRAGQCPQLRIGN
jgi:hypothetical protein